MLLVNPGEAGVPFERIPPLGLAYIAASVEAAGLSVRIADLDVQDVDFDELLTRHQPRVVGVSGTTHTRHASFELARRAKRHSPDIITVYGGVHATFTSHETLAHVPDIDIVVRGEGELTMPELVAAAREGAVVLRGVAGVSFRERGDVVDNPDRPRIGDLDALGAPALHLLDMKKYHMPMAFLDVDGIAFISSRGCTARCVFCSASAMYGHQVTCHSPGYVVDSVSRLMDDYGYRGIRFFDSTFTLHRRHVEGICDEIVRRGLRFPWECEVRVGSVDLPLLQKMRAAGCYYVDFGVESASQRVLDHMRKAIRVEAAQQLLDWCEESGLKTKVFFSFGHIGETPSDVDATFRFIDRNRNRISTLACGAGVRIYPGTYLEEYARANGLIPAGFSWTGDFRDSRLADLSQDPTVPLLLQPALGLTELSSIRLRIVGEKLKGRRGAIRAVTRLASPGSWRKLWAAAKLLAKRTGRRRQR